MYPPTYPYGFLAVSVPRPFGLNRHIALDEADGIYASGENDESSASTYAGAQRSVISTHEAMKVMKRHHRPKVPTIREAHGLIEPPNLLHERLGEADVVV